MFTLKTISGSSILYQNKDKVLAFSKERIFTGACFLLLPAVISPCLFNGYQAFLHANLPLIMIYATLCVIMTGLFFYKKIPFRIRIGSAVLVFCFSGLLPHFSAQPWYEGNGLFRDLNAILVIVLILWITALEYSIRHPETKSVLTPGEISRTGAGADRGRNSHFQKAIGAVDQVKALQDENQKLKEEVALIRRFKETGHLSKILVHDLNSILSGIAGYPEVLLMDTFLDTATRQGLMMIRDTGQKAADMVSEFLTILTGITAEKEPVDLNFLIDSFFRTPEFEILKTTFPEISVKYQFEPELIPVNASYSHLEKSVTHLLWFAVSHLEKNSGHGRVMIETSNRYFDKTTKGEKPIPPGEYSSLRLHIYGVGLEAEHAARLFEPFYIKKTMKKERTGLEMAVVWNTVLDHGGFIQLTTGQSEICFDLHIPSLRTGAGV